MRPVAPSLVDSQQAHALRAALAAQGMRCDVEWIAQTSSTNGDLLQLVRDGKNAPDPQLLVAGHQTAGRGRQGRIWHDDDASLLMSLAWPFPVNATVTGLSLAVGVWLAHCLEGLGAHDVRLKWPNDVLIGSRKLAGILIEIADTSQARWAVIGIGVNLGDPPAAPLAVGLRTLGLSLSRWDILRTLVPRMLANLPAFVHDGFRPWSGAWNQLHAWAGKPVSVLDHGNLRDTGFALGVDGNGCLMLQTPHGLQRIANGDISLRLGPALDSGHSF